MFDTKKLSNGKVLKGSFSDFESTKGWFVGSFFGDENPLKTDMVEIMYKEHAAGDNIQAHYHKEKVEILLVLQGRAIYKVNDREFTLVGGDFLFIDVNNVISGQFVENSKIFAIHSPSLPKDKFIPE